MKDLGPFLRRAVRSVASTIVTLAFWVVWLALGAIAAVQIYVASRNELSVPDFILRRLEAKVAENGFRVTFQRATFDPTGRILVEAPRVLLPDFEDPIITARAAYVGLNPLALAVGKVEAREIRLIDAAVAVPAMLSPSGRTESIIRDVDALVVPGTDEIAVRQVSARIGALLVSVHGSMNYIHGAGRSSAEVAATVRTRFREFCHSAVEFARRLDALEEPSLDLELVPSPTRGAIVRAELSARGFKLDAPVAAQLGEFHATTQFPLLGDTPSTSRLHFTADELRLPGDMAIRHLTAIIRGRVHPAELRVEPVAVELAAGTLTTPDLVAEDVVAVGRPASPQGWEAEIDARVLGAPLTASGQVDIKAHSANLRFAGSISPRVLDVVTAHSKVDVRKFFDFQELHCDKGTVEFGPGWKFQQLAARVALRGITARGVTMDEGSATVQLDSQRLFAPEAYARIGENYARGTYEQVFATREFRFLLDGRLRPMEIDDWFRGWWTNFFSRFGFPATPPSASVDVSGIWREGRKTSVFVFADADKPVVMGQKLQRVRTRLFIRPGFYDGLELHLIDPAGGAADGTFTVATNMNTAQWRSFDVEARSAIALDVARGMGGAFAQPLLGPFELARSPTVSVRGHFDGPAANGTPHRSVDFETHTVGDIKYHNFPLQDVAFTGELRDDELTLNDITGKFATGSFHAHAKAWGATPDRRLSFSATITDASLSGAVAALQEFSAERNRQPKPAPGRFVKEKMNVRLDAMASAEGLYANGLSYHGSGSAALRGPEIGEVPLFGPLSELLKFTALRFTSAKGDFKINGSKLEFPGIALRGANSAIDAHGEYALDRRQLDFRAKVFPFQESGNVIKTVVGAVLTPFSNVLEVKLTGTLEKPDWAFVIGPTNLLRSLAPGEQPPPANGAVPTTTGPAPAPTPTAPPNSQNTPTPAAREPMPPVGAEPEKPAPNAPAKPN